MSELEDKVKRSINVLRMYRGDESIEVSYSGGKDSDVILALTPTYIQCLWVRQQNNAAEKVIYIPAEANLPILEAK